MKAKIAIIGILMSAVIAGAMLYYLQVYAYYEDVSGRGVGNVQATLLVSGEPEGILFENYTAIDADSSPLRFRACFETPQSQAMMTETYFTYEEAEPRVAPPWFDCFDAEEIGGALKTGEAIAFLGVENITYGIDRVIAVMPDGRAFSWHQINACGEVVFDGNPTPDFCPPKPESDT